MGNINSLKGILLFSLRNGYREVHFENGKLPLIVSEQGERTHLQGVSPTNKETIYAIKKDYLSGDDRLILSVSGQEFLVSDLGEELVFRHLPYVDQPLDIDNELASACYSKRGIILVVSNQQEKRSLESYRTASYIASNKKITLCIIENSKFYSLRSTGSKIINIYKPGLSLDAMLRITEGLLCDCVMVPNCNNIAAVEAINMSGYDKLIIVGTATDIVPHFNKENIIYTLDVNRRDSLYTRGRPEVKLNTSVILENLRG